MMMILINMEAGTWKWNSREQLAADRTQEYEEHHMMRWSLRVRQIDCRECSRV